MKAQRFVVALLIIVALWSFRLTPVNAAEAAEATSTSAFAARLQELESEVAALRAEDPRAEIGPAGGCHGATCVPCCEPACCDCCPAPCLCPCGWYAGGEFVWLEARWNGFNAARIESNDLVNVIFGETVVGHDYDYEPTGRFWAGYSGCSGLGVRASWWEFDHDSNPVSILVPNLPGGFVDVRGVLIFAGTGETFVSRQSLELETLDFEATGTLDGCGGRFVTGFGARYVKLHAHTSEHALDAAGVVQRFADLDERFEGVGPTLSLDYFLPLCFSGWSFYTNLRGTVAFGEQRRDGQTSDFNNIRLTSTRADQAHAIAELQIALQWCSGAWFTRAGWQAQYWDDIASSKVEDFNLGGGAGGNAAADLALQGFFVALGAQF